MVYEVLIVCNDEKRDHVIERLKEFQDVKNIEQRKNKNEILAKIESEDEHYVENNVVQRIQDMDGIHEASIHPFNLK